MHAYDLNQLWLSSNASAWPTKQSGKSESERCTRSIYWQQIDMTMLDFSKALETDSHS